MIDINRVTINPAADFPPEYWQEAERVVKDNILVNYDEDAALTVRCEQHALICTDTATGDFICQTFLPTAYEDSCQIIRQILADDINMHPEMQWCILFAYCDGLRIMGADVDLTQSVDVSDLDATITLDLANGAEVILDFSRVDSITVESEDPGVHDKTWTLNLKSGVTVVISYTIQ